MNIENLELEDRALLQTTEELDTGDTMSCEAFREAMGWDNHDS